MPRPGPTSRLPRTLLPLMVRCPADDRSRLVSQFQTYDAAKQPEHK